MKNKIIEILMSESFNTSDEAGNSYIVTSSEDFEDIAERIVKLFAIPDVVFSEAEFKAFAEKCNNMYSGGCGTVDEFITKVNKAFN